MAGPDPVITKSALDNSLKAAVEDIAGIMSDFSNQVDARFTGLEQHVNARFTGLEQRVNARFTGLEQRMDRVEERVDNLDKKFDKLLNTLDAFLKRLDDMETENTARDAHMARLDRWLHQVADKVGIELK